MAEFERGQPDVARLSSEHDAVVVLHPDRCGDPMGAAPALQNALSALYSRLGDVSVSTWTTPHVVVAVVRVGHAAQSARAALVWGLPVAAEGEPGDRAVRRALEEPSTCRDWLGGFLLAELGSRRARLVTGTDLRPTLRVAEGPAGTAFATRSLAAVVAAGRRPRVDRDRIAELVSFGAVLGEDELIADVRRLPEGSLVDIDAAGITTGTASPRADRFAPGPPSTPEQLRTALGDAVESFAGVPQVHLAMTGGRDSLLIASCAAERDIALPSFTFGPSPDATAAGAVAESLGWPHVEVGFDDGPRRLDEVVRLSCWTEGATTAWDLAGPGPVWPGPRGATWLAGLGGETGRAFYWDDPAAPAQPAAHLTARAGANLPDQVRRQLGARVEEVLGSFAEDTGRSGVDLLDVFYALGRARGWMMRNRPMPFLRSTSAAYTGPAVTSVLLDLPATARVDGSGFDRALVLGPPLRERAAQALDAGRTPLVQRARRALRTRLRRRPPDPGGVTLVGFAREIQEASVVRATLGDDWWNWMLEHAPHDPAARLQGWQALAVDAVERWVTDGSPLS